MALIKDVWQPGLHCLRAAVVPQEGNSGQKKEWPVLAYNTIIDLSLCLWIFIQIDRNSADIVGTAYKKNTYSQAYAVWKTWGYGFPDRERLSNLVNR